ISGCAGAHALAVLTVAGGADLRKDIGTTFRVRGATRLPDRKGAHPQQTRADGNTRRDPFHVGKHRFDFWRVEWKRLAVHGSLHAAVDPLLDGGDLVLASAILWERSPNAEIGH